MKTLRNRLSQLPIQWKLIIGSSLLLCFLFISYNAVQYLVINHWLMNQEGHAVRKNMEQLQLYFSEKKTSLNEKEITDSRNFIDKMNQRNQMIRILDNQGHPILTISEDVPEHWVTPQKVTQSELISLWHITDHLLVMRTPLISAQFTGTIEIVDSLENLDKVSDLLLVIMLIGGLGALILSGLGAILLTRQLLKPIQSITDTMRKIKNKGLHERVIVLDNHDEISKLTIMFNEMMDQLEISFQQQKQFVEDASHELRTPIAIMEGHLSLLRRWGKDDPALLNESLNASLQELIRLKGLVQELLELSRADTVTDHSKKEQIDPCQIISAIVKNIHMLHPEFIFDTNIADLSGSNIAIVPHHFEQILLILLDNAVKYSADDRKIHILGSVYSGLAQIQIIDCGIGIPSDELPSVFDRFYRVDKARSGEKGGHGLGLSIAQRLIERYDGTIYISSTENKGTSVTIGFPLYKQ
ncbi:MAG: signal transduction histidine kinase [Bacilli bacterium]|jgi:two-component system sensor histidine kinase ArlS|nr:signal transduction histidine kinase [Bacilli bacterium]